MDAEDTDLNLWAQNLGANRVQIWREALEHLRHLSDEVWKVFKCFMVINGFLLVLVTAFAMAGADSSPGMIILAVLAVLGVASIIVGRYLLKRNRVYYLEMLLKKTLLEDEFGFYSVKFNGTNSDLAFPWRLRPETISELKQSPEEWVKRQVRGPGTIARWLFVTLETVMGVYLVILAVLCYAALH
jgi:hypothetical protein